MSRFNILTAAISSYRKNHGPRADSAIRARTTGVIDIDNASDEMLERAMEGQKNTATTAYNKNTPKSWDEVRNRAWSVYNNPPRPKPEG